ncbi:MAG: decarboxylase [Rubrivivax sp.]
MKPVPDEATLDALADELQRAYQRHAPLAPISERIAGFDGAAAHAVARRLRQRRLADGATSPGRKIGFTNRSIWPLYGVYEPIWGTMYADSVHHAGAARGTLSLRGLPLPRIEPEIVLHLASAPQPGDGPAELLARVDQVAHGFEIVQSVYPGWRFTAADAVAGGALHGALLIGPPQPLAALGPDPLAALASFTIELSVDGRAVARGRGDAVLDSPVHALAHLVQVLRDRPADEALRAGEWVSTGTLTDAQPVAPGQTWRTRLTGLPLAGLELSFTD